MPITVKELESMKNEELEEKSDWVLRFFAEDIPVTIYLDELKYRKQQRMNHTIKNCTVAITWMTIVITVATAINIILFCLK